MLVLVCGFMGFQAWGLEFEVLWQWVLGVLAWVKGLGCYSFRILVPLYV